MGSLTLVVGGQKSGKSTIAGRVAAAGGAPVAVVAPARAGDPELARRIARHQADRPAHWHTIETFDLVDALDRAGGHAGVVVDALDTWLLEAMTQAGLHTDEDIAAATDDGERIILGQVDAFLAATRHRAGATVVVAGQPGLGAVAIGAWLRRYVDLHGLVTRRIADAADDVLLAVAGRALPLPAPTAGDLSASTPALLTDDFAALDLAPDRDDGADRTLGRLCRSVPPLDAAALDAAQRRHDRLAKPPGSLGEVERVGAWLAGVAGRCPPPVPVRPAVVVAAGDHGVHARGVSNWPQQVTATMAIELARGRASANAIARRVGAEVAVVDVGVAAPGPLGAGVVHHRVRAGTRDLTIEPAMTVAEAVAAILVGARVTTDLLRDGTDLVVLGEVGIANTTAAAALIAAVTSRPAEDVTGRGAGGDDAMLARKVAAVEAGLRRYASAATPERGLATPGSLALLASLGGLEHAALVGAVLAAAAARVPVVADGVSTLAAMLMATELAPHAGDRVLASHRSVEPGAAAALAHAGARPLLDLALRLGEGTGGLLAVPIVQAAAAVLLDVADLGEVLEERD